MARPKLILGGFALLAVAGVGLVGMAADRSDAAPAASAAVISTARPSPSSAAVVKPTPTPTPKATAKPTPKPRAVSWAVFRKHVMKDVLRKSLGKFDETNTATWPVWAKKLQKTAHAELTWLNAHPPAACYRPTWTAYDTALTKYEEGAKLLQQGLKSKDDAVLNRAYNGLTSANAWMAEATARVPGNAARC